MLIKNDDGSLAGLLCVNFDDSRFLSLHDHLLSIAHPIDFLKEHSFHTIHSMEEYAAGNKSETLAEDSSSDATSNIDNLMQSCYRAAIINLNCPTDRLTQEERMDVIRNLQSSGFFKLKGAVPFAAKHLHCSTASIYRYLNDLKNSI